MSNGPKSLNLGYMYCHYIF